MLSTTTTSTLMARRVRAPMQNPFQRKGDVPQTFGFRSLRRSMSQVCWILLIGAFLVTALAWAIPQPPTPQSGSMALFFNKPPAEMELRKSGRVRRQLKIPATQNKKMKYGRYEDQWDPDTLEQSGDSSREHGDDESRSKEISLEITVGAAALTQREELGPFGEEGVATKDLGEENHQDSSSRSYDPNDPDEADEQPAPKFQGVKSKKNVEMKHSNVKKVTEEQKKEMAKKVKTESRRERVANTATKT